jgi:WD40 repeat protein
MHKPTLKDLRLVSEISRSGDFLSVACDTTTNDVFVGNTMGKIYRLRPGRDDPFPRVIDAHVSFVSSLVVTGDYLISAGSDHRLLWWDRKTHDRVREVEGHTQWIRHLALSPDGARVASVCDDMVARLFDTRTGSIIHELRGGHEVFTSYGLLSKLYACAFSRHGKYVATADQMGFMVIWETSSGRQVAKVEVPLFYTYDTNGHTYGGIRSIDFSPDGKFIAAGGNLGGCTSTISGSKAMVQIYDWGTGEQTHDMRVGGNFFYERVRYHHEGTWLVGAGGAGSGQKLVFFDLAKKEIAHAVNLGMLTFDLELSGKSDTIYVAGRRGVSNAGTNGTLVKWDLSRRRKRV